MVMVLVDCLEEWLHLLGGWRRVPEHHTLPIGFSHSLLFDVLIEIPKSCEAVCFFFLPKPGFGCGLGNQVGGGRLRAMVYRKTYRTHNIGGQAEVGAVAMGLVGG